MRYSFDIDGVICTTNCEYEDAKPNESVINDINNLYNEGHHITIYTARGGLSKIDWSELTKNQLDAWGINYHKLRMDKEPYDILYDDRAKKKREHILFIGAHPDDIEISCGGTILKHIENGDLVVIMCMSNDRDDEFRRVYEGLNCKIEISSFKDKEVPFNTKSVEEIEEIIRKYNIDTIYTHNDFETHQDHINTHLASMSTSRLVRNVYLYEIVPLNRPYNSYMNINRYVDISDYIVDKLKLISKNTSQINKYRLRGENLLRRVFNLNNHRGDEINVNYAEGFHVVKEVIR